MQNEGHRSNHPADESMQRLHLQLSRCRVLQLATANGLPESMGIDSATKPAPRLRRKKRQFCYECQDEVDDVETKFKREFFYEMIHTVRCRLKNASRGWSST